MRNPSGLTVSIEGWGWIGRKKSVSKIEQLTDGGGRVSELDNLQRQPYWPDPGSNPAWGIELQIINSEI